MVVREVQVYAPGKITERVGGLSREFVTVQAKSIEVWKLWKSIEGGMDPNRLLNERSRKARFLT